MSAPDQELVQGRQRQFLVHRLRHPKRQIQETRHPGHPSAAQRANSGDLCTKGLNGLHEVQTEKQAGMRSVLTHWIV